MARNLVVCCDGTGNKFGARHTNVVKLCFCLQQAPLEQLLFYDPGVGTMPGERGLTRARRELSKILDGATATTLFRNVAEAYAFLAAQYQPGDRIFLFGFSRGAYTVRVIAAILHMYGLLYPDNENLVPYIQRMYTRADEEDRDSDEFFRIAEQFKATFARDVKIHFLGVWDTVSSVGWFFNPQPLPYTFHNPSVAIARHAVSIDERRAFFRTNLLGRPPQGATQDFKQVWFAGVHCDVGGGYAEDVSGLSQLALDWMLGEAHAHGLMLDRDAVRGVLGGKAPFIAPDYAARANESLVGGWKILEGVPRKTWSAQLKGYRWRQNRSRARLVKPEGLVVHWGVDRRIKECGYKPANLPEKYEIEARDEAWDRWLKGP